MTSHPLSWGRGSTACCPSCYLVSGDGWRPPGHRPLGGRPFSHQPSASGSRGWFP